MVCEKFSYIVAILTIVFFFFRSTSSNYKSECSMTYGTPSSSFTPVNSLIDLFQGLTSTSKEKKSKSHREFDLGSLFTTPEKSKPLSSCVFCVNMKINLTTVLSEPEQCKHCWLNLNKGGKIRFCLFSSMKTFLVFSQNSLELCKSKANVFWTVLDVYLKA